MKRDGARREQIAQNLDARRVPRSSRRFETDATREVALARYRCADRAGIVSDDDVRATAKKFRLACISIDAAPVTSATRPRTSASSDRFRNNSRSREQMIEKWW